MAIQGKTDIDQLLAKSLKEIAVRRPVEKITIKEITDKAILPAHIFLRYREI